MSKKDSINKSFKSGRTPRHRNIGIMIGTIIVLFITIVAFILVPALSQSAKSGKDLVFGYYGKSKIDYVAGNYFARQIEYINNVYRDSDAFKDNVEYKRQLVWQTAFNQTVIQKAIEEELNNSGASVTDDQIDKAIVEKGPYMADGKFDETAYKNAPAQTKYDLRTRFHEELLRQLYSGDILYGAHRSDALLNFIANMGSDEKSFNYAIFGINSLDNSLFVNYGTSNVEKFTKASLNRITIKSSKENAQKLHDRIASGEITFKDAAIAESKDNFAAEGGNAGDMYFYEISSDLGGDDAARKVFAMKDKDITEVIETSYGWIIFQMINNPVLPDVNSEDMISVIKDYMSTNERGLIEDSLVALGQAFSSKLSNSADFISTASSMNIENGTTDYFTINYGSNRMLPSNISTATNRNPAFSSANYDDLFQQRLFALKNKGDVSDPLVLGNNIIVAQLVGDQKSTKIPEESMDFYKYQIESEITGYTQNDLQNVVMSSPKFKNNFLTTFAALFYANNSAN